jgi:hypothetical protein
MADYENQIVQDADLLPRADMGNQTEPLNVHQENTRRNYEIISSILIFTAERE